MSDANFDHYLSEINNAYGKLKEQQKAILSQAEFERRKIDVYFNEKGNELKRQLTEQGKNLFSAQEKELNEKRLEIYKQSARKKAELEQGWAKLKEEKENLKKDCCFLQEEKEKLLQLKKFLVDLENGVKERFPQYKDFIFDYKISLFDNCIEVLNEKRALKSKEIVDELKVKYKEAIEKQMELEEKISLYKDIFPVLNEDIEQPKQNDIDVNVPDMVSNWLTQEEYFTLPEVERNQRALDNYLKKSLSKWEIGKMYERYIGWQKEQDGYKVDYNGIKYKKEDKGIDLICEKNDEVLIIQCKNWSSSKTIFEKHIFQFFGTLFYAREKEKENNPFAPKTVRGIFYTTTEVSDFARNAANTLGIELVKNDLNKGYPCIKCNIGKNGEKIYHLPFDQQYDSTVITPNRGEFYARTCQEAERAGFRRAMKHFY